MEEKRMHRLSLWMLIAISLIWGTSYLGVQAAIDSGLPFSFILGGRFLLGALLIGIFQRGRICRGQSLLRGMVGGVLIYFAFYCQTEGQSVSTISTAAFLTATNVVMIPFVHWASSGKKPANKVFFCCGLTFLGVFLLSYRVGQPFSMGSGGMMVLLGAFLFALHMVYLGDSVLKADPGSVTFWQLLSAGVAGTLFTVAQRPPITAAMLSKGWLPVLYVGIMATGLCYYLEAKAQKHVNPSQTGVMLSMEGVYGSMFSILAGLEAFQPQVVVGGLLITLSVVLMEINPGAKFRRRPEAKEQAATLSDADRI